MRCSPCPFRPSGALFVASGAALVVTCLVHAARGEPAEAATVPFAPPGGPAITVPFGPGAGPSTPTAAAPPAAPAVAPPAPAAPAAAPAEPRPDKGAGRWYGYYVAPVDVLTGGLAVLAFTAPSPSRPAQVGAAAAFALGAPLVHVAHGKPLRALLDLSVRVTAPAIGYYLGGIFAEKGALFGAPRSGPGALVGAFVGGACAMVVDWLAFSWDTPGDLPSSRGARASVAIAPSLALTPSGGAVALGGAF